MPSMAVRASNDQSESDATIDPSAVATIEVRNRTVFKLVLLIACGAGTVLFGLLTVTGLPWSLVLTFPLGLLCLVFTLYQCHHTFTGSTREVCITMTNGSKQTLRWLRHRQVTDIENEVRTASASPVAPTGP
jgi:hypothetical protein